MTAVLRRPEWVDRAGSTTDVLLDRIANGLWLENGHVLAAREQTAGYGRSGHSWFGGRNTNLTFSFVWDTEQPERCASLLAAVALGVCDYLRYSAIGAVAKWPNDILVENKKLCGLLADQSARPGRIVVGVGLNVNMHQVDIARLACPATSMRMEKGRMFELAAVLNSLLDCLDSRLRQWEQGGFEALRADWEACTAWIGRYVTVQDGETRYTGRLVGFGPDCELLLQTTDGLRSIWTGHMLRCVE